MVRGGCREDDGRCGAIQSLAREGEKTVQRALEQEADRRKRNQAAGRRNANRFIMSLGSPVTPATPVERVRRYCDAVHAL